MSMAPNGETAARMNKESRRTKRAITAVLFLENFGSEIYFMGFSFHLIERGFSYSVISWTIASTALVGVFLGPRFGHYVDRVRRKSVLLGTLFLATSLGLALQIFTPTSSAEAWVLLLFGGVAVFAIAYNPTLLVLAQYLEPRLDRNEGAAYAFAAKVMATSDVAAALAAFLLFEIIGPRGLIAISCVLHVLCAGQALLLPQINRDDDDGAQDGEKNDDKDNVKNGECRRGPQTSFGFVLGVLRRNVFLILPLVAVSVTISAVEANTESIIAYLEAFPVRFIFLATACDGAISMGAAHFYSKRWTTDRATETKAYYWSLLFFVAAFALLFFADHMLAKIALLLLAASYLIFSIAKCWWSILSHTWMRQIAENQAYARTMAAIKVPRALFSFLGVGAVGFFLDRASLGVFLGICILIMMTLLVLLFARAEKYRKSVLG